MLLDRVLSAIEPGTEIPKPKAREAFRLKGEGMRRGERAIIYTIPNHRNAVRPYEKGITASELEQASEELVRVGRLTRTWWNTNLRAYEAEGACNFTTIGGLLELLGEAEYVGNGVYRRRSLNEQRS